MKRVLPVAALCAASLCGCAPVPYSQAPELPYAACGVDQTSLRAELTGNSAPSPQSDALLRELGVRCVGGVAPVRPRLIGEIAPGWIGR